MSDIKQAIQELRSLIDNEPVEIALIHSALDRLESSVEGGTVDITSRIEAAAEEIAKQADEVWPSLRCDNCGSFVLLRNIPEDGYDCRGCSNFTRTPDEVIGITKIDLEKLATAIIRRHLEERTK